MEPDNSSTKAEFAMMHLSSMYLKGLPCYSGHVTPSEETLLRPNIHGQRIFHKGIPPTGRDLSKLGGSDPRLDRPTQYTHDL